MSTHVRSSILIKMNTTGGLHVKLRYLMTTITIRPPDKIVYSKTFLLLNQSMLWVLKRNVSMRLVAKDKMQASHFIAFSSTRLLNSIKHEHSCKILYVIKMNTTGGLHVKLRYLMTTITIRPPDKIVYSKTFLLLNQSMLWVLKRNVSMRRFF